MRLTGKQHELGDLLTKARLIERGMARQWWGVIPELIETGLLCRCRVLARWPLPEIQEPVFDYWPGEDYDAGAISYRLQSRWHGSSVRELTAYVATKKLGRLHGVRRCGRPEKPGQCTHDLGLTQVLLQHPELQFIRGEEAPALQSVGRKRPDAAIVRASGVLSLIEFGGAYSPERVREFLEFAEVIQTPCQLY